MKKLLLLLFLVPVLAFAQLRDSVYVKNSIYELVYNENLEEPLWIKYTVQCPNGTASREGMDFYTDKLIHTSDAKDYVSNVYDKGHMAPAADFNCTKEMLFLTFSYLNCSMQNQYLNRGVWKSLETQEREWAKQEQVTVLINVVFNKSCIKVPTGATVPIGYYKTIHLVKLNKTYKYYFVNDKPKTPSINDYLVK
jgi:endonuclease G